MTEQSNIINAFEAQYGKRDRIGAPYSDLPKKTDAELYEIAGDGDVAKAILRDRREYDRKRTAWIYAWNAATMGD